MLDEERFWTLIAASRETARRQPRQPAQDFLTLHEEALREVLRRLSPEEIIGFQSQFNDNLRRAYRWELWGAAYWFNGGCGDDGFMDFRSCLISLGKEDFFRILDDPDNLASLLDRTDVPYMQAEGFQYVAASVYKEKTGDDSMPEIVGESRPYPVEPLGERFDFDDESEIARHYPRLYEKLPEGGD